MSEHRIASSHIPAAKEESGLIEGKITHAKDSSPKELGSGSLCSSYLSASPPLWDGTTTARAVWLVEQSAFLGTFTTLRSKVDMAVEIPVSWTLLPWPFLGLFPNPIPDVVPFCIVA